MKEFKAMEVFDIKEVSDWLMDIMCKILGDQPKTKSCHWCPGLSIS